MREYGQVQSAFWQSVDAQAFSDTGKLLALYLLTGPHANGLGCYRLPDGYVMADLGWSSETISKGFAELSSNGFANRFDGVVFVPNFLRWNKIANGNIATARFSEWDSLPKGEAKSRVSRAMLEFCRHWSEDQRCALETVTGTVTQTVCQPEPNPTQPRENPTKREGRAPANRGTRLPSDWQPGPHELRWAQGERPEIDVGAEAEKFRDYWHGVAGSKGVKLDWPATWRNWIRRADAGARGKSGGRGPLRVAL